MVAVGAILRQYRAPNCKSPYRKVLELALAGPWRPVQALSASIWRLDLPVSVIGSRTLSTVGRGRSAS